MPGTGLGTALLKCRTEPGQLDTDIPPASGGRGLLRLDPTTNGRFLAGRAADFCPLAWRERLRRTWERAVDLVTP